MSRNAAPGVLQLIYDFVLNGFLSLPIPFRLFSVLRYPELNPHHHQMSPFPGSNLRPTQTAVNPNHVTKSDLIKRLFFRGKLKPHCPCARILPKRCSVGIG